MMRCEDFNAAQIHSMDNSKGQANILYLLLTIAIAFILASGVILFSRTFKVDALEDTLPLSLESVAQQLEAGLLDIKYIVDTTNATSANITLKIPDRIGEQRYHIKGLGDDIELRTDGDPSAFKILEINFWQSIDIRGAVESGQGSVTLILRNSTAILLQ